jgi:antitoxin ChpS
MVAATLRAVGRFIMVAIPKSLLRKLGLSADAKVALTVEDGQLIVERQAKPRCSLDELIAECNQTASAGEEDRQWEADEAAGCEVF